MGRQRVAHNVRAFCSRPVGTSCADILCNPPCANAEAQAQALATAKAGVTPPRTVAGPIPTKVGIKIKS